MTLSGMTLEDLVLPCNRAFVNVTIKLDDTLCRQARHRAVDEGLSLSGWIGKLLDRELAKKPAGKDKTLLGLLGDRRVADLNLEIPRLSDRATAAEL